MLDAKEQILHRKLKFLKCVGVGIKIVPDFKKMGRCQTYTGPYSRYTLGEKQAEVHVKSQ